MLESKAFDNSIPSKFTTQVKLNWNWNSEKEKENDCFTINSTNLQNKLTLFTLPEDNPNLKPVLEIDFNQTIKLNRFKILSSSKLIEIYYKERSNNNLLNYISSTRFKEKAEVDSEVFYLIEFEFDQGEYDILALKFLSLPINSKSELKVQYFNIDIDEKTITSNLNNTSETELEVLMKSKLNIQDNESVLAQRISQLENHMQLLELKFQSELNLLRNEIKDFKNNNQEK